MKTVTVILLVVFIPILSWPQRLSLPIMPVRPILPNRDYIVVGGDVVVAPDYYTNQPETTETNPMPMGGNESVRAEATNSMPDTSGDNPALAEAFEMTNRLSVMAPAQVQNVIDVQTGLDELQQAAASFSGIDNLHQELLENHAVQKRMDVFSGQIASLARGPGKPSSDSTDRLSFDLLKACSRGRLATDQQLVLAVVINLAVNCQNLPAGQIDVAINSGLVILQSVGVTPALCNNVACDLRSITLELQPNSGF